MAILCALAAAPQMSITAKYRLLPCKCKEPGIGMSAHIPPPIHKMGCTPTPRPCHVVPENLHVLRIISPMAWDKADNPGSQALYHFNFQGYGPYTYVLYLGLGMGGI
jgi:hypothetical protein